MDRALTARERGILEFMLDDADIPGGGALRAQVPHVRVVDGEPTMPTWLHLRVNPAARPADGPDGLLPAEAVVEGPSGEMVGWIMVWIEGGYLSAVEHPWVTDTMPSELPSPDLLRRWDPKTNRIWDPRHG